MTSRREFLLAGAGALLAPRSSFLPARPVPSASQLLWQRDELALFLHFGVNTFTDREWGDGKESPSIFNPTQLDARQWTRAAKAAGFRAIVLTAKHHDGFCLWPTATTTHSVASSPFRNGGGDVVRELVDACRADDLRVGLYLSPWDRNHPTYGDTPRYNDVYAAQLTELLTRYGEIHEVWFDGANGEGPNGKRQVYDWPRVWGLVRRLQPQAVMFSDAGPDVRWCGNEKGSAGDPNWSTVDPARVPHPGADGPHIIAALQHGDRDGSVWRPAEADVSIRPGWFYHPAQDAQVRTVDNLVDLYCSSVGRNSKLLLNVPPTPTGLLHETDVARLAGMRRALDTTFAVDVASGGDHSVINAGPSSAHVFVNFRVAQTFSKARMTEDVTQGQRIERYSLEVMGAGGWKTVSGGTTIGYAKIDRFAPVTATQARLTVHSIEGRVPASLALFD
jgi:alpha-L-fucosidase